jgi:hypothetical protein
MIMGRYGCPLGCIEHRVSPMEPQGSDRFVLVLPDGMEHDLTDAVKNIIEHAAEHDLGRIAPRFRIGLFAR